MHPSSLGIVELFKAAEKGAPLKGQAYSVSYHPAAKSYILSLESHTSRLSLPAVDKPLSLICPYVNFQVFILPGKPFTVELGTMDSGNTRRRLVFSSAVKSDTGSLMHARISNEDFPRNVWTNLCIDVVAFMRVFFPSSTFRSIEEISVFSFCRLKRIFGSRLPLTSAPDGLNCILPKSFEFNAGIDFVTVLIAPHSQKEGGKPPVLANKTKASSIGEKLRELRTASPQTVQRIVSSSSPAPRPQKSAPPHRLFPKKPLKPPTKPGLRGTFTQLPPAKPISKIEKVPIKMRALTVTATANDEKDYMRTTAYSKFDSAATNMGDEAGSVQEEIEEDVKTAEKTVIKKGGEVKRGEGGEGGRDGEVKMENLRKASYLEAEMDLITNGRPFSPPFLGLSDRMPEAVTLQVKSSSDPEIELIHDPVLHCYFNPATQEFFELDN